MRKIAAEELARKVAIEDKFIKAKDELTERIQTVTEAVESMNTSIAAYNEVLDEAVNLRDDVIDQIDEYIDGKSERWQEGDKGDAYAAWKTAWEDLDFESLVQTDLTEVIPTVEELEHLKALNEVPESPDE